MEEEGRYLEPRSKPWRAGGPGRAWQAWRALGLEEACTVVWLHVVLLTSHELGDFLSL